MGSPLSVGDVLALSKLAITLGRAFTKGRRSAPEEFREVESQLYSLSAALDALTSLITGSANNNPDVPLHILQGNDQPEADDSLSHAIRSCRQTLTHLETVVTTYGVLKKDDGGKPVRSRFRRWDTSIKTVWKSIVWTTEGGDLAVLRSNLTVHMNSLNLLLGVMVNTQTGQLKTRVDQIHRILQDIRSWLSENLPTSAPASSPPTSQTTSKSNTQEPTNSYFQLYEWTDEEILVCSLASLSLDHYKRGGAQTSPFTCNCPGNSMNALSPHKSQLEAYQVSPLSFGSRIAGSQRTIMLYKISDRNTASMKTILIKRIPIIGMAALEEVFLHQLPLQQSRSLLRRNMSTLLCFPDVSNTTAVPRAHILHLTGDPIGVKHRVRSVKIEQGLSFISQDSIDAVQFLHYKTVDLKTVLEGAWVSENAVDYNRTAEVTIFYGNQHLENQKDAVEMSSTALELTPSTIPRHATGDLTVQFEKINSKSSSIEETDHVVPDCKVTFEFLDHRAALDFFTKVENMRMELFIIHLQFPRPDETVLLNVLAKDVHTENLHIESANIQILRHEITGRYRLLIVGKSGYCIISQNLAENFLFSVSSPDQTPNFRSLTYVVQMDDDGSRKVRQYPRGFACFDFSDASVDRLFKIGLGAIAGTAEVLP